jgi:hypothetical protein
MRKGRAWAQPAKRIVEPKDTWEWRERLPLELGRQAVRSRGRSGVAFMHRHGSRLLWH